MYNNQYIIASDIIRKPHDFKELIMEDINIYYHTNLIFNRAMNNEVKIYLLGYIIDPFSPFATNQDIINNISEKCNTLDLFFKFVQNLSGRFVILYKNHFDFVAINDACALRQLYYYTNDNKVILTSSEKMFLDLFGVELMTSQNKNELIRSENFRNNDNTWFGDNNYDDRLKKLLPNHYFAFRDRVALRTPIFIPDINGEDDIISYIANILEGSMNAITSRYKVYHALTAGWDSRVILSASKSHKDAIQYYIFDYSKRHQNIVFWDDSDKNIPKRLSQKIGFNFTIYETEELRKDFLEIYNKENVNPRILPKTSEIQYYFDMGGNFQEKIRLTGIGGEVGRCRFGFTKRKVNNRMLYYFSGYGNKFKYINDVIDHWMESAIVYSNEYNIPLLDLFYWENKMANWGAQYLYEQDIAIEEFWPLSNKNIFLCLFKIPAHRRSLPECKVHRKLIQYLWPEILCEPINPLGRRAYIQMMLGRYSTLRYYKARYHL